MATKTPFKFSNQLEKLACPSCKHDLENKGHIFHCSKCGVDYPVSEGIINLLPRNRDYTKDKFFSFYEEELLKNAPEMYKNHSDWKAELLFNLLNGKKFASLLEIGCGGGLILKSLSNKLGIKDVCGLDFSEGILRLAQRNNPGFIFVQGDGASLPFKSNSVDLSLMVDVLEHLENPERALNDVRRVSKYFALKIPLEDVISIRAYRKLKNWKERGGHINFYSLKSIRSLLKKTGFRIEREILRYTPLRFEAEYFKRSMLDKAATSLKMVLRLLGEGVYRRVFPLWYIALYRVKEGEE